MSSMHMVFFWGYGHLLLFVSAAAVGAGLSVAVDYATHHTEISSFTAGMAVALPVALYLSGLIMLHHHTLFARGFQGLLACLAVLLILLTPFTGHAVLLTGILLAGLLTTKQFMHHHA